MKKFIISIAIILISIASYGQAKINRAGPANTVVDQNLNAANTFIMPYFNDTTLATVGLDSCGKIFYNRGTASVWYRACIGYSSRKWIEISVNSSPTISAWLTRGNDLSTQSLPNRLGTKNGDQLNIITTDLVRAIIPAGGIVRSSSAQNKYVMIDTVGKELYYGDATGSTPTWQQTLTAGSTLTGNNTIAGGGFDFIFENTDEIKFGSNAAAIVDINNPTNIIRIGDVESVFQSTIFTVNCNDGTDIMSGDNTGHTLRFGINTTTPDSALKVVGGIYGTRGLRLSSLTNLSTQNRLLGQFGTDGNVGYVTLAGSLSISSGVLTGTGITGLTVGTTTISSGTTTRILYDNAGVLGEYTLTGTGTVVAMQTAPTFITSITSPLIIGGTGTTSTLTYKTTTGAGDIGADHIFLTGNNGGTEAMRILNSGNIGIGTATPNSTLHVAGSLSLGYRMVESDSYEIATTDYTLSVNNGASDWSIILPDASTCTGRIYIIKRYDNNSTGLVTVDANSCDVQSPATGSFNTTFDLTAWGTQNQSVMFQSNGTNWEAIK